MVACQDNSDSQKKDFAYGADVSWITELEAKGAKFHAPGDSTEEMECMQLLRDRCGVDAIRLRVWVNPEDGWNGLEDVLVKARRVRDLGMRLMIDFHFSDTWADPGHQHMPKAWENLPFDELTAALAAHVAETLTALKNEGIDVEWVQIGNETTPGMMLPAGSLEENPDQLVALNNAGYDAVKAVYPDAICIVHLDCGNDQARYDAMFDVFEQKGGKYDMIGMSLYPFWAKKPWSEVADDCIANINHVKAKYGRPVMICEIGMHYQEGEDCKALIKKMMGADIEGIFYWEPEAPSGYNDGYDMGCFVDDAPNAALEAFVEAKN